MHEVCLQNIGIQKGKEIAILSLFVNAASNGECFFPIVGEENGAKEYGYVKNVTLNDERE